MTDFVCIGSLFRVVGFNPSHRQLFLRSEAIPNWCEAEYALMGGRESLYDGPWPPNLPLLGDRWPLCQCYRRQGNDTPDRH
ncbi:MAG: hypothetical protein JF621_02390 [Streptomyces turgidiscabies]|nr:hypothetical protein [Streptomyces turgidiscabies]